MPEPMEFNATEVANEVQLALDKGGIDDGIASARRLTSGRVLDEAQRGLVYLPIKLSIENLLKDDMSAGVAAISKLDQGEMLYSRQLLLLLTSTIQDDVRRDPALAGAQPPAIKAAELDRFAEAFAQVAAKYDNTGIDLAKAYFEESLARTKNDGEEDAVDYIIGQGLRTNPAFAARIQKTLADVRREIAPDPGLLDVSQNLDPPKPEPTKPEPTKPADAMKTVLDMPDDLIEPVVTPGGPGAKAASDAPGPAAGPSEGGKPKKAFGEGAPAAVAPKGLGPGSGSPAPRESLAGQNLKGCAEDMVERGLGGLVGGSPERRRPPSNPEAAGGGGLGGGGGGLLGTAVNRIFDAGEGIGKWLTGQSPSHSQPAQQPSRSESVVKGAAQAAVPPSEAGYLDHAAECVKQFTSDRQGFEQRWSNVLDFVRERGSLDAINADPVAGEELKRRIEAGGGLESYEHDVAQLERSGERAATEIGRAAEHCEKFASSGGDAAEAKDAAEKLDGLTDELRSDKTVPKAQTDENGKTTFTAAMEKLREMIEKLVKMLMQVFSKKESTPT